MSKKLICSIFLIAVFAVSAHAQFISGVAHRNTDTDATEEPQIAPNLLEENAVTFVDRTHVYADIPESILGAQYVMLANDNKNMSSYELDLTIAANATLYVFVDNRMGGGAGGKDVNPDITGMPWLNDMGFVDTGEDIGIDESFDGDIDQYFSIYSLLATFGTITIYGNTEGHGGNMLGVAALGPKFNAYNPVPADGSYHYEYSLPFIESNARGFFTYQDRLFILDYPERTLYDTEGTRLFKVEDMKGWYVRDVVWFGDRPLYCSRNRVLYKQEGKVRVVPIDGAETLESITTDGTELYLLDVSSNEIVVLDSDYYVIRRMQCTTRRPVDIAYHEGSLWLLDLSDRCVHQIEKDTGQTLLKIQAGLRGSSKGLVFIGNEFYVHDAETSSLRLVCWDKVGSAVLSCHHPVQYQFVQDSWNESETNTCTASFFVPLPPSLMHQSLGELQWSETPNYFMIDRYNQILAVFENILIPPQGYHRLSYVTEAQMSAIQYELPELPLESLEDIPSEIAMTYLVNEDMYSLDAWNIRQAALAARDDFAGNPPQNVKGLIENIVDFVLDNLSYVLDSRWDNADVVLDRGEGSCSEYSFLFSALCRLNGIPTRLVGGIGLKDMGVTNGWHRWTDVWYPTIGWIPLDVTKIDADNPDSYDYEFLFGLPGYMMTFSTLGGDDPEALGREYFIRRYYQGGQRRRTDHVENLNELDPEKYPVVTLTLE